MFEIARKRNYELCDSDFFLSLLSLSLSLHTTTTMFLLSLLYKSGHFRYTYIYILACMYILCSYIHLTYVEYINQIKSNLFRSQKHLPCTVDHTWTIYKHLLIKIMWYKRILDVIWCTREFVLACLDRPFTVGWSGTICKISSILLLNASLHFRH